jgi:hypothetical protein
MTGSDWRFLFSQSLHNDVNHCRHARQRPSKKTPAPRHVYKHCWLPPSYRRADQDVDFLERDEAHGLRLHLDYLKPERLLMEQGVR